MVVLFKRLCWVPFLNSEIISRFPSVFATREDIGTTSATAGDSLKTLPKKTDSILLISALGILLDTPPSSRNGYAFGFLLFLSGQQHHFSHILQGGITMISQQGGFKEVIKKAFPEADFSQWSKNPIPCLSFLTTITDPFPRKNKKGSKRERFQEIKNCREEFLHFAQQKGFDPLQTENWYHIKSYELREHGAKELMDLHGGMKSALKLAFPELSFSKWGL